MATMQRKLAGKKQVVLNEMVQMSRFFVRKVTALEPAWLTGRAPRFSWQRPHCRHCAPVTLTGPRFIWTRPLHTAHLIVLFLPWTTSCDSYVDVSDSKQYSSSVKMWTTDLSKTHILHRGPHALHTSRVSSEPQQRRLDVPACPLNDT
ncbi:uncharacterized protein LOC144733785 [Lampetra planeri]